MKIPMTGSTTHRTLKEPSKTVGQAVRNHCSVTNVLLAIVLFQMVVVQPVGAANNSNNSSGGGDVTFGSGTNGFNAILERTAAVAKMAVKWVGVIAFFLGGIIWAGTTASGGRSQWGMKLTFGGLALLVMYFGSSAILGVMKWIGGA